MDTGWYIEEDKGPVSSTVCHVFGVIKRNSGRHIKWGFVWELQVTFQSRRYSLSRAIRETTRKSQQIQDWPVVRMCLAYILVVSTYLLATRTRNNKKCVSDGMVDDPLQRPMSRQSALC